MSQFEPLIGAWRLKGEMPFDPPLEVHGHGSIEWLGAFLVQRWTVENEDVPDSISIAGGADGAEQPSHYFDQRGIARVYFMSLSEGVWRQRRDPDEDWRAHPGFDQRFVGELSADGKAIAARWEKSEDGSKWKTDFELSYERS